MIFILFDIDTSDIATIDIITTDIGTVDIDTTEIDTIDNDENWTMYHVVPMEWNKAVIYEAGLFHSPIIKPGMYTGDEYRTSINIFAMVK